MPKDKGGKSKRITRLLISVLTVVLIALFLNILTLVADIQGTARVVNYAGLVRGTTQRIVKLEDAGYAQDKLLSAVDSYIDGLRFGSDELDLVALPDDEYQAKMAELSDYYDGLRDEIALVREVGYENTDIIAKSEEFFGICDTATKLAEDYSQKRAGALDQMETIVFAVIGGLLVLFFVEIARALATAAQNRALQKRVYLDEATGLPNKNKCEEVLAQSGPVDPAHPVALVVFDLNNLRTINNNLGHDKGDEYIAAFAAQLGRAASSTCFIGRDGGDEFIAVIRDADRGAVETILDSIRADCIAYSDAHPSMPLSYAAGWALSSEVGECTMRDLFRQADKNMYIDKNRAKRAEAAERARDNRRILKLVDGLGKHFTDVIYCDARLDQYRAVRTSSEAFLADEGGYSGAVEQIASTLFAKADVQTARKALSLETMAAKLGADGGPIEVAFHNDRHRGRMTCVFIDADEKGLHHFAVGFAPVAPSSGTEQQQLSRYFDQMRQSILENGDYVGALLQSAQAAYSVNLTDDSLDKVFTQPSENRYDLGLEPPCSYDGYCRERRRYITEDTQVSYRLVDTSAKLLKRFEAGVRDVTIEYRERTRDGGSMWLQKAVLMSRDVVDGADGAERSVVRGIILFRDTSAFHEQEQLEKQRLEQALEDADSEMRAKTEFMNRMSHDFRTPINGIIGMLEMIDMAGDDPARLHDCLHKIHLSAEHLLDLVNDVLDMNKLSSGKAVLERNRFDLYELMDGVRALVDAQLADSDIEHASHREGIRHPRLVGSDLRLRQILLNLFSNSVKYNKPGGRVDTYVHELSDDGGRARFEFKIVDTGIGMSRDFVENELFKPFTQESLGARTHYRGTGLGMSIVKSLVDAMGGTIDVQSEQGVGTSIAIELSFDIDDAAEEDGRGDKVEQPTSLEGKRVLLVEDNELNMEIAEFYLASAGASVVKAWNGKEAVEAFSASAPGSVSLILMDLMMPVMDGLSASRAIRSLARPDSKTVPIIAMTANVFEEDRERTRQAGMDAHLSKPLEMNKLLETVANLAK